MKIVILPTTALDRHQNLQMAEVEQSFQTNCHSQFQRDYS